LIHAVEFYYDLLKEGKIKVAKKYEEPITIQEPCNIIRGLGLGDKLRYIMDATCSDFRDVTPRYEHNFCCAAGGGTVRPARPTASRRLAGAFGGLLCRFCLDERRLGLLERLLLR